MKNCVKCSEKEICSGFCKNHFRRYLEDKVKKTIRRFSLFAHKQKIAVAVSGGKDSTVLLYILKKLKYDITAITVDPGVGGYSDLNIKNIRKVCEKYGISLKEISFEEEFGYKLKTILINLKKSKMDLQACMICGVLKRYLINKFAKENKFDIVTTGHNLDDEAQAFLMNIFRNDVALAKRQGLITGNGGNKAFVTRAKPLYLCTEKETTAYSKLMKFPVNYERCPCSKEAYRKQFVDFLDEFEKKHPSVKHNIINFFLETLHKEKGGSNGIVGTCELCGEPSARKICKKCEIINTLNESILNK